MQAASPDENVGDLVQTAAIPVLLSGLAGLGVMKAALFWLGEFSSRSQCRRWLAGGLKSNVNVELFYLLFNYFIENLQTFNFSKL
jgi:hypothetical protein